MQDYFVCLIDISLTMLTFVKKYSIMKIRLLIVLSLAVLLGACQKNDKDSQYLITKNSIGNLTPSTPVYQLDSIFAKDSVVRVNTSEGFSAGKEIKIFNSAGQLMLRLQPVEDFDSTSTIANIEVIDTLYHTKHGLGKGSRFKTLKANYNISRIENIVGAAVVFVDELNAYVIIDKEDILAPKGMGVKIKTSQIKEEALIRHFWIGWK